MLTLLLTDFPLSDVLNSLSTKRVGILAVLERSKHGKDKMVSETFYRWDETQGSELSGVRDSNKLREGRKIQTFRHLRYGNLLLVTHEVAENGGQTV